MLSLYLWFVGLSTYGFVVIESFYGFIIMFRAPPLPPHSYAVIGVGDWMMFIAD